MRPTEDIWNRRPEKRYTIRTSDDTHPVFMITPPNQEENMQDMALHRRHIIEIIIVLVALVVTFYAGYSLGHDHGADDQTKIGPSPSTPIVPSHPAVLDSTSTPTDLINHAPATAIPN